MEEIITKIPFDILLKEFLTFYKKEYGEISLQNITEKVHKSKQLKKYLSKVEPLHIQLGASDFITAIHSSTYFLFAKPEEMAVATVIFLCMWNKFIGVTQGLSSDVYLNKMLFRILEKFENYKVNLANKVTFFERFYRHIEMFSTDNRN